MNTVDGAHLVSGQGWQQWLVWPATHPLLAAAGAAFGVLLTAGVVLGRDRLLAWRHHRLATDARWVTISAPPQVGPGSAAALWTNLTGILTPAAWTRRRYGIPHVAWEYTWAARTLTIRLWVPATIPPGAVEAAVTAAWPGATTSTTPAADPIPAEIAEVGEQDGGALWPAHADVLPLRTDHDTDPLRALLAAGSRIGHREHACLQVLARPAHPRRLQAARRATTTPGDPARAGSLDATTRLLAALTQALVAPVVWLVEVFLPGPTLAMVPKLLNERTTRLDYIRDLNDPEGLKGFWTWYDSMNDALRAQVIGPVLARLRAFLLRDFVENVIGQPHSSFRMGDVLDGGILLCRLPKGILGKDTARILGSLIVARTWQAAIAHAAVPEAHRRDATLYVDECHNFLTLPEVDDHDLAHLNIHTAAARLLVGNRELPAFTFTTNAPPPLLGHAVALRAACAARHADVRSVPGARARDDCDPPGGSSRDSGRGCGGGRRQGATTPPPGQHDRPRRA